MVYRKSIKKSKRIRRGMRGGGCGCSGGNDQNAPSSAAGTGISSFLKGGGSCGGEQPSFSNVPLKSFYGGKDESTNPLYSQVASRLDGGKKSRKSKRKYRKTKSKRNIKKIKGGRGFMNSEPEFKLLPTVTMA